MRSSQLELLRAWFMELVLNLISNLFSRTSDDREGGTSVQEVTSYFVLRFGNWRWKVFTENFSVEFDGRLFGWKLRVFKFKTISVLPETKPKEYRIARIKTQSN